jgi:hypothetical protein
MKNSELRVFADNQEVWEGDVGADAGTLNGPLGIRSDNARLEFEFLARESEGAPAKVEGCKAQAAEE